MRTFVMLFLLLTVAWPAVAAPRKEKAPPVYGSKKYRYPCGFNVEAILVGSIIDADALCRKMGAVRDDGSQLPKGRGWAGCARPAKGKVRTAQVVLTDSDSNLLHEIRHVLDFFCRK